MAGAGAGVGASTTLQLSASASDLSGQATSQAHPLSRSAPRTRRLMRGRDRDRERDRDRAQSNAHMDNRELQQPPPAPPLPPQRPRQRLRQPIGSPEVAALYTEAVALQAVPVPAIIEPTGVEPEAIVGSVAPPQSVTGKPSPVRRTGSECGSVIAEEAPVKHTSSEGFFLRSSTALPPARGSAPTGTPAPGANVAASLTASSTPPGIARTKSSSGQASEGGDAQGEVSKTCKDTDKELELEEMIDVDMIEPASAAGFYFGAQTTWDDFKKPDYFNQVQAAIITSLVPTREEAETKEKDESISQDLIFVSDANIAPSDAEVKKSSEVTEIVAASEAFTAASSSVAQSDTLSVRGSATASEPEPDQQDDQDDPTGVGDEGSSRCEVQLRAVAGALIDPTPVPAAAVDSLSLSDHDLHELDAKDEALKGNSSLPATTRQEKDSNSESAELVLTNEALKCNSSLPTGVAVRHETDSLASAKDQKHEKSWRQAEKPKLKRRILDRRDFKASTMRKSWRRAAPASVAEIRLAALCHNKIDESKATGHVPTRSSPKSSSAGNAAVDDTKRIQQVEEKQSSSNRLNTMFQGWRHMIFPGKQYVSNKTSSHKKSATPTTDISQGEVSDDKDKRESCDGSYGMSQTLRISIPASRQPGSFCSYKFRPSHLRPAFASRTDSVLTSNSIADSSAAQLVSRQTSGEVKTRSAKPSPRAHRGKVKMTGRTKRGSNVTLGGEYQQRASKVSMQPLPPARTNFLTDRVLRSLTRSAVVRYADSTIRAGVRVTSKTPERYRNSPPLGKARSASERSGTCSPIKTPTARPGSRSSNRTYTPVKGKRLEAVPDEGQKVELEGESLPPEQPQLDQAEELQVPCSKWSSLPHHVQPGDSGMFVVPEESTLVPDDPPKKRSKSVDAVKVKSKPHPKRDNRSSKTPRRTMVPGSASPTFSPRPRRMASNTANAAYTKHLFDLETGSFRAQLARSSTETIKSAYSSIGRNLKIVPCRQSKTQEKPKKIKVPESVKKVDKRKDVLSRLQQVSPPSCVVTIPGTCTSEETTAEDSNIFNETEHERKPDEVGTLLEPSPNKSVTEKSIVPAMIMGVHSKIVGEEQSSVTKTNVARRRSSRHRDGEYIPRYRPTLRTPRISSVGMHAGNEMLSRRELVSDIKAAARARNGLKHTARSIHAPFSMNDPKQLVSKTTSVTSSRPNDVHSMPSGSRYGSLDGLYEVAELLRKYVSLVPIGSTSNASELVSLYEAQTTMSIPSVCGESRGGMCISPKVLSGEDLPEIQDSPPVTTPAHQEQHVPARGAENCDSGIETTHSTNGAEEENATLSSQRGSQTGHEEARQEPTADASASQQHKEELPERYKICSKETEMMVASAIKETSRARLSRQTLEVDITDSNTLVKSPSLRVPVITISPPEPNEDPTAAGPLPGSSTNNPIIMGAETATLDKEAEESQDDPVLSHLHCLQYFASRKRSSLAGTLPSLSRSSMQPPSGEAACTTCDYHRDKTLNTDTERSYLLRLSSGQIVETVVQTYVANVEADSQVNDSLPLDNEKAGFLPNSDAVDIPDQQPTCSGNQNESVVDNDQPQAVKSLEMQEEKGSDREQTLDDDVPSSSGIAWKDFIPRPYLPFVKENDGEISLHQPVGETLKKPERDQSSVASKKESEEPNTSHQTQEGEVKKPSGFERARIRLANYMGNSCAQTFMAFMNEVIPELMERPDTELLTPRYSQLTHILLQEYLSHPANGDLGGAPFGREQVEAFVRMLTERVALLVEDAARSAEAQDRDRDRDVAVPGPP